MPSSTDSTRKLGAAGRRFSHERRVSEGTLIHRLDPGLHSLLVFGKFPALRPVLTCSFYFYS